MGDSKFIMIGAMYENGGNVTQRFLDGHPELYVYPYESQVGTKLVQDQYSSMFPLKYRWPTFPLAGSIGDDYEMIIDEECKVRTKTPFVSKFRDEPIALMDSERKQIFIEKMASQDRTSGNIVEGFFHSTFEAWKDFQTSGRNRIYVGYSPIITVDTERIFADLPGSHFIHVVRNPFSAYAETKKRPVPMSLKDYISAWVINQYYALMYNEKYPEHFSIIRFEDLIEDSKSAFMDVCNKAGFSNDCDTLLFPSWNGKRMEDVYPWGTIRIPTPEENKATADLLSKEERGEIYVRATVYIDRLYGEFIQ